MRRRRQGSGAATSTNACVTLLWKASLPALLTYSAYLTYCIGRFPHPPPAAAGGGDASVAVAPPRSAQDASSLEADAPQPTADGVALPLQPQAEQEQPQAPLAGELPPDWEEPQAPPAWEEAPREERPDPRDVQDPEVEDLPLRPEQQAPPSRQEQKPPEEQPREAPRKVAKKEEPPPKKKEGRPPTWHYCAKQWDDCHCPGTLRWGNGDTWLTRNRKSGEKEIKIACSIMNFKDILPGDDAKHCECSAKPTNPHGVVLPGAAKDASWEEIDKKEAEQKVVRGKVEWIFCASQWQECACPGKVRWGSANKFVYLAPKPGLNEMVVKCSIDVLADIAPGDEAKHCDCLTDIQSEFFEQINPGFLELEGLGHLRKSVAEEVTSCAVFESVSDLSDKDAQQWKGVEAFCSDTWTPDAIDGYKKPKAGEKALDKAVLRSLLRSWVHPRFKEAYARLASANGWIPRAFVNYYAGAPRGRIVNMTEELIRSVHAFSAEPIVVMHFGFATPEIWTPEEFPRLLIFHVAPMPPTALRSFNFNKLRAMLLSRVIVGIELDSDQWVAPGVDRMFKRTEEEVTKDYPIPILPSHFLDWGPSGEGPGGIGAKLWDRYCPEGKEGLCRWQTQRWGHAHPTWTFWAVPFLGRWLRRNFRDETLPANGEKKALRITDVLEDEDLLNVGTWEEKGTKQWCKFDLPDPMEFETVLLHVSKKSGRRTCTKGDLCDDIGGDARWHPKGVAKVFYTAHHAVDPAQSRLFVQRLKAVVDKRTNELPPPILYQRKFYADTQDIRKSHPDLTCIV